MPPAADELPTALLRTLRCEAPTPLVELPRLATHCGIARALVKDESRRLLGSFKSLGGTYAGLRALARAAGLPNIEVLIDAKVPRAKLPRLICASDGNHGLAVAAAAHLVGGAARVYLHSRVPSARANKISAQHAEIVWVEGTYDDAVDAACRASKEGEGLLVSDTSNDPCDPITADVMAGYGLMAREIIEQFAAQGEPPPTHLLVQAGVGGLAAALARGLGEAWAGACRFVVVEPSRAACVGPAIRSGRIERLPGDLETVAEMLSCGEASAPAVELLRKHGATAIDVGEGILAEAVTVMVQCGGPATTPSGAAGIAGLLSARPGSATAQKLSVVSESRVLMIATEGIA